MAYQQRTTTNSAPSVKTGKGLEQPRKPPLAPSIATTMARVNFMKRVAETSQRRSAKALLERMALAEAQIHTLTKRREDPSLRQWTKHTEARIKALAASVRRLELAASPYTQDPWTATADRLAKEVTERASKIIAAFRDEHPWITDAMITVEIAGTVRNLHEDGINPRPYLLGTFIY